jgi:acetoin utilization protein AcuB
VAGAAFILIEPLVRNTETALEPLALGDAPQGKAAPRAGGNAPAEKSAEVQAPRRAGASFWVTAARAAALVMIGACFLLERRRQKRKNARPSEQPAQPGAVPVLPTALYEKRQQLMTLLANNLSAALEGNLKVRHFMTERLLRVRVSSRIDAARDQMKQERIRHLLVCDAEDRLVGIVSDRDLHSRKGTIVSEIMTAGPLTVEPDTALSPAVTLLINKNISCLPVVKEGTLFGILTTTDLLLALQCNMQLLERVALAIRTTPLAAPAEPAGTD